MAEQRYFVITGAAPRRVQPRDPSKNAFDLLEVYDDQGNKWVVRQDVFNLAQQWVGQRVLGLTRIEQNGNFTNYFLDSIELAGAQGGYPAPQPGYQPAQQAQAAQQPPPPQQRPIVAPTPAETQASIHRQVAAKVAAALSQTASEFWSNVILINHYFETGQIPRQVEQGMLGQPVESRPNAGAYSSGQEQLQTQTQYNDEGIPF